MAGHAKKKDSRPEKGHKSLIRMVGRAGIEPATNGLKESSFSQVVIKINLLQYTPRSKRSYTQPESNCKELKGVTKWLRSLSSD